MLPRPRAACDGKRSSPMPTTARQAPAAPERPSVSVENAGPAEGTAAPDLAAGVADPDRAVVHRAGDVLAGPGGGD